MGGRDFVGFSSDRKPSGYAAFGGTAKVTYSGHTFEWTYAIALGGAVMGKALELSAWPKVDFDQWPPIDALAAIESLDLAGADENACLGAAVACARLVRRMQAMQAMVLARACDLAETGRAPTGAAYEVIDGVELVGAEAGLALTLSKGEAGALVQDAVQVTGDLPLLAALAHEGRLDWALAARTHHRMSRALRPGTPAWRQAEALLAERLPARPGRRPAPRPGGFSTGSTPGPPPIGPARPSRTATCASSRCPTAWPGSTAAFAPTMPA
jgi:hypothetical protein